LNELPNDSICMSITKYQSIAMIKKCGDKIFELAYIESLQVICTNSKKENNVIKLWRETQDGISLVSIAYKPTSNQFDIVGIQVADEDLYLNVLVRDANGISRYFHLIQAQIFFTKSTS
ncbi:4623_t:CDS:2, partial [Ambispora gerdemannii]